MINYRETKRTTLKIQVPEFTELFNRLAVSEEELTFQRPVDKDSDLRTFSMLSLLEALAYPIPVHVGEIKTEGTLLEQRNALSNLRSKSKLARDEQGTNILYLSFGFLEWREDTQWVKSPVLMVPVSLKLESIQAPYTLLRDNDDIEVNPTLDYLFNGHFGVDLPTFELSGEESIDDYMRSIEEIADQNGWKLVREVSLGLLSFLKISMYHDLNNNYERMLRSPVIQAIIGAANSANIPDKLTDPDTVPPSECYQVVNSDSSQQEAISLSKAGVSFVMQGPPGTGKSQTITNIIAEALASGKTILFVSEKLAALQVVYKKLSEAGLDKFCLALHSHKANKKEILDSIEANLRLPRNKRMKESVMFELTELFQERQGLNTYVRELHGEIHPLGKSLYEAFGELVLLRDTPRVQFDIQAIDLLTSSAYNTMLYRVAGYAKSLRNLGIRFSENPWHGVDIKAVRQRDNLFQKVLDLDNSLLLLYKSLSDIVASFGLREVCSWAGAMRAITLFNAIEGTPLFPLKWSGKAERDSLLEELKRAQLEKQEYLNALSGILAHFKETVFSEDMPGWLAAVSQTAGKIRLIDTKLRRQDSDMLESASMLRSSADSVIDRLEAIIPAYERGISFIPFTAADTLNDVNRLADILSKMLSSPAVKKEWFDAPLLERAKRTLISARTHAESLSEKKRALMMEWEESVFNIDSDAMLVRFKTEYRSFFKIFKTAYRSDIKTIRGVSKRIRVKITDSKIIDTLQQIGEINADIRWFSDNRQLLSECFGSFSFGLQSDWEMIEFGLSFVEQLRSLFPQSVVPGDLTELLCDKAAHLSGFAELSKILSVLNSGALKSIQTDIAELLSDYADKSIQKTLLPSFKRLREESDLLASHIARMEAHAARAIPNGSLPEKVAEARRVYEKRAALDETYQKHKKMFGSLMNGQETDWCSIISGAEAVSALFARDESRLMTEDFVGLFCEDAAFREKISKAKADLKRHINESEHGYDEFKRLFEDFDFDNTLLNKVADRVNSCLNNSMLLDRWISCVEAKSACNELGLADFTEKIEQRDNTLQDIAGIFKRGFFTLWVESVIGGSKTVEHFRRHVHDAKIERFTELDSKQLLIAQERIGQNVVSGMPDTNRTLAANDERSILQREIGKKRRIMPLRKLFKSIPNLLLKLKPCMMMSPLSVAYFLEAESYEFDMVIFDEASQIFPQDAIGSIFRGKQVIIAGDSKQLPPTNFFATGTNNDDDFDEEDEETDETGNYDSILEETARVLPNRTLLWHYRSKHENLIAFSNQEIYRNELITFPSSVESGADLGVEFVYVEDGVYEGKGRNTSEARKCVELVKRHIERTPNRTLGIIAFSESQQKAIALELQKFREEHPNYESFFTEDKEDEFFVKNLENVQGDERDTIIFSVSYAKTRQQKDNNQSMALRFGPLGQKGGERRLNVAVTRAKRNIKLVASILPSDIDLSRTGSEGVIMLRQYIEFAMNGSSALHAGQTESEKDAFLDIVAEYLTARGYKIKKYVGCSGNKIDIAVTHPENENCFVAGIECDGFSYAAAKSARDRDHLRKSVLEAMGWRIYRVWSPEWRVNQDIEAQKLLAFIDTAMNEFNEVRTEPERDLPAAESFTEVIDSVTASATTSAETGGSYGFVEYREAAWQETPNINDKTAYNDGIAEMIKYITGIEQPIHIELLCRRMAGVFGNQKVTVLVRDTVDSALRSKRLKGVIVKDKDNFITLAGFNELKVRIPANGNKPRQIDFISPGEIGLAMLKIAGESIGLTPENLIDATVKELGYARKGDRMIARMGDAFERLVKHSRVKLVDGKVRVIEVVFCECLRGVTPSASKRRYLR
jgi:very-short-patch-repair endonuclease